MGNRLRKATICLLSSKTPFLRSLRPTECSNGSLFYILIYFFFFSSLLLTSWVVLYVCVQHLNIGLGEHSALILHKPIPTIELDHATIILDHWRRSTRTPRSSRSLAPGCCPCELRPTCRQRRVTVASTRVSSCYRRLSLDGISSSSWHRGTRPMHGFVVVARRRCRQIYLGFVLNSPIMYRSSDQVSNHNVPSLRGPLSETRKYTFS